MSALPPIATEKAHIAAPDGISGKARVNPIVLYLRHAHIVISSDLSEDLPNNGAVPKSPFLPIGNRGARRQAQSKISTLVLLGASGLGALAIGPIDRSIEEECRVQLLVRDNNVDQALSALKNKMARGHLPRDEAPPPLRTRSDKRASAIHHARKLARKKIQREGFQGSPEEAAPRARPCF